MEISIVILSCVILGLNPEMPVFIRLIMICNLNGFRQIKYIQTKYGWELDHLDNMVPRTVPSGTLSAPPDILQLINCNCKASGYRTAACIAARTLGARFYVYVRVRKPVKILRRVARRKMNPSRLLRTQMMIICDDTIFKLMRTHHKYAKLHSCWNKFNLTLNICVFL